MNQYRNIRRRISLVLLLIILMNIFFCSLSTARSIYTSEKPKRVLLISSYSPSFITFDHQVKGIKSQSEGENIELDIEFMDTKRLYTKENLKNFYDNLKYKIQNLPKYDAIIVGDDNALNFAYKHQRELFYKTPIVFMGIGDYQKAERLSKSPYITGVIESISIKETIDIAKKLNSKGKNIIALTDNTETGQAMLKEYYNEKGKFKDLNFKSLSLTNLSYREFGIELGKLSDEDIVLLLTINTDKNNLHLSFDKSVEYILEFCNQPVYHNYYYGIGDGLLGGKVISHIEQGSVAASIVKQVFKGKDISKINYIKDSPNKYVFDYAILKKYKFDADLLPEGTIFINKEIPFFKQYFKYILIVIIILLFQFSLIMFLQVNIAKRKKSEKELLSSKEDLMEINEELVATNEELIASIDEIRIQDEKIHELVYTDMVTGLHNRFSIFQLIDSEICKEKHKGITAIVFLDVDNFKNINDTYGHDMGDRVLKIVGDKLKAYENEHTCIGRFGGDEFLIMIKNQDDIGNIIYIIEVIHTIFDEEVVIKTTSLFLTVSTGISLYPYNGNCRGELVKKADLALYEAKNSGKNKHVFYEETMNELIEEKMYLQEAIKKATKKQEFYLNFQPYINCKTKEVIGFEALIRWNSKEHGYVSPFKLITNAEELGLMIEIGELVLKEACAFAKKINEKRKDKIKVSVNISATQLMHNDFYERTIEIVEKAGLSPMQICLEMTETILIESIEKGTTVINRLADYGFAIALDDFGTGYSSLKYFKDLPVDILKIDKSFIDNITLSSYSQNLIDAMINIAHYKGVEVIAEGVETKEQLSILKKHDCDMVQGFLFSKPLSEEETLRLYCS
ncbi:EAL domain-containing protein [Clostridiaceae bacterium M8S5]|nr:EAL domain-containing protein [Clostridiaceae bacterium M8S5]